jgi:EAL domain-containing protein (putative c-di-GMP-specific phosphodiesterase class I)
VETAEQLVYLEAHRCRYFQGYHFSRPLEARVFNERYLTAAAASSVA